MTTTLTLRVAWLQRSFTMVPVSLRNCVGNSIDEEPQSEAGDRTGVLTSVRLRDSHFPELSV